VSSALIARTFSSDIAHGVSRREPPSAIRTVTTSGPPLASDESRYAKAHCCPESDGEDHAADPDGEHRPVNALPPVAVELLPRCPQCRKP
jgi:hypothetical protein